MSPLGTGDERPESPQHTMSTVALGKWPFCVKRLTDLPMLWSEQWRALGLQAPIQLQAHPS